MCLNQKNTPLSHKQNKQITQTKERRSIVSNGIINDFKCSNPNCNGTLSRSQRSGYSVTENEKEFGILCDKCNKILEANIGWITMCGRCGKLVNIFISAKLKNKRAYTRACKRCGGSEEDENTTVSKFKHFINKLKHLIK